MSGSNQSGAARNTVLRYGTPEEAGMDPRRLALTRERVKGWVDGSSNQAIVVLAARRGVIVLHEAYGSLTPEPESPPLPLDAIFPIASNTKPFIATAVMQLVEDGLVGLNRPVQDYLPEFAGEGKDDVLVWHLLTHTSGLRGEDVTAFLQTQQGMPVPPPEPTANPIVHAYLHRGLSVPLWKAPGEEMSYCNFNYTLLAGIVRRVSGESVEDLLRQRIFDPLGLKDTYSSRPDACDGRLVQRPPTAAYAGLLGLPLWQTASNGGSGVPSTALDIAVFGQAFLNGGTYGGTRILSPASVREMTRNQIPGISAGFFGEWHNEASWGYGWALRGGEKWKYDGGSLASPEMLFHGGAGGTRFWVAPSTSSSASTSRWRCTSAARCSPRTTTCSRTW